ncbi:MAG TPA: hypothetical protein VJ826_14975 [Candidatus Polarisedimenticolaceae bacterium]|nr:hypothetical protein [Candidatus Polarisedimenticolaceae bacterium]
MSFAYERRGHRPIPRSRFVRRFLAHFAVAVAVTIVSIGLGMAGYVHYEHLSANDAFLNVAMLLGGMGPVNPPMSEGGKLFAGFYALYAGLFFIVVAGILVAPVAHRVLHRFHWDEKER